MNTAHLRTTAPSTSEVRSHMMGAKSMSEPNERINGAAPSGMTVHSASEARA
ncbi:hypothetical protein ACIBG0_17045 [Nocardia sp. NPDC050630]|uniref:hypothetical protein n=1 Tax=Nocardia sp. NPDC050630 TaxID=3364321 RepID=UPI003799DAB1